jgi:hypothetical protein
MTTLVYLLLVAASVGFTGALTIHIAALLGSITPFQHFGKLMFPGLVVVWLPTIFCMNRLTRDVKQKDLWKAALRGCPRWMRTTWWIVAGYSWIGAFAIPLLFGGGMNSPLSEARSVSGIMLAFYGIAVCVLYSSTQAAKRDGARCCLNGHHVGPLAKFCDECGAPVAADAAIPLPPK